MAFFRKESLDTLRQRVDIVDVISSHIELKRAGAFYKALCPFHDEKSPSFMVQKGDSHYHCFGCGAHGDAIQFLIAHQKMTFVEAIESLAQRFHVPLEKMEEGEDKGPNKTLLKEALEAACSFFHFYLLHTPEGHSVLPYLYSRQIDLDFIRLFRIGLSPAKNHLFRKVMKAQGIRDDILTEAGLLTRSSHDFFSDRIMFPIHQASGAVIGFSGRKYKEETYGGKYVNTPETPLFKKSYTLFGLNYSRRRIAKDRTAIIVEGQVDALRLIKEGLNITVAGQGTAFGEGHAQELLQLGVNLVYLALDADEAGKKAALKIGDLFQKKGVEAKVLEMPSGSDPDLFLREHGIEAFQQLLDESIDYLTFLVQTTSKSVPLTSPALKAEFVQTIAKQVREWDNALMVHESLRKLASLLDVPPDMLNIGKEFIPHVYIKNSASIGTQTVDPDLVIEMDFLYWLFFANNSHFTSLAQLNLLPTDLHHPHCQSLYQRFREHGTELLTSPLPPEEQQLIHDISLKKVNREKAEDQFTATLQHLLNRNWMEKRETINNKIKSSPDDLSLVKEFDALKQPKIQVP